MPSPSAVGGPGPTRRRSRPVRFGSLGWGHNSQWKTDFRRDYVTHDAQHFNVDGQIDIAGPIDRAGSPSETEMRDLVRHRCLVRHTTNDQEPPFIADCRLTVRRTDQSMGNSHDQVR